MENQRQTQSSPFLLAFALVGFLFSPILATADPCEAQLGKVDPAGAVAVRVDENRARDEVAQEFEHANSNDADMQWKAKDAGKILQIAADHHSFETPYYAAGISKAMMKGDVQAATILSLCAQRRSGQASADQDAGNSNHDVGVRVTEEDVASGGPRIYDEHAFDGVIAP